MSSSLRVVTWLILGFSLVVFNKLVLTTWKFPYAFFLVGVSGVVFTTITQILAVTTELIPCANNGKVTLNVFVRKLVPVSLLFWYGLVATNWAFMFLTLSSIQMLKSIKPVVILLLAFLCGREKPSILLTCIIAVITCGVVVSSLGELDFSAIGVAIQLSEVFSDCVRMIALDVLLKDVGIDALSLLYFMAPINTILGAIGFLLFELPTFQWIRITPMFSLILLTNGLLAFAMQLSSLGLIQETSAVVLTICGPLRDIALIVTSVLFFGAPVTLVQIMGYTMSLGGLVWYRAYTLEIGEEAENSSLQTRMCGDGFLSVFSSIRPSLSVYDGHFEYVPVSSYDRIDSDSDDDGDDGAIGNNGVEIAIVFGDCRTRSSGGETAMSTGGGDIECPLQSLLSLSSSPAAVAPYRTEEKKQKKEKGKDIDKYKEKEDDEKERLLDGDDTYSSIIGLSPTTVTYYYQQNSLDDDLL